MGTATLEELRQRLAWPEGVAEALPLGVPELAALLPQGYRPRTLVEWLGAPGGGATTLACRTALAAAGARPLALLGPPGQFFPPALLALGLPLERTLALAPRSPRELAWALEEVLRCPALGAVLATPTRAGERAYRRWQLATGTGCRLGVLTRGLDAEREPCWAAVRWRVEALPGAPRQALVTLLRSWGQGRVGGSVRVRIDGEAMVGGVAPELADPAPAPGRPELDGRPMALFAGAAGTPRVVAAACRLARQRGVRIGMPLAEALALAGDPGAHPELPPPAPGGHAPAPLHAEPHDPAADRLALRRLARSCQRWTPLVALDDADEPDTLLLDIVGCTHRAGGEAGLAERLAAALARKGWGVRLAVADTAFAAAALARGRAEGGLFHAPPGAAEPAVRPLSAAALRPTPAQRDLLAALGLATVGMVADLPRDTLAARFGDDFVRRLSLLLGRPGESPAAEPQPLRLRAAVSWESPCADAAALAAARGQLLRTLLARLPAGFGLAKLVLLGRDDAGGRTRQEVVAARPSANRRRWEELLRLRQERAPPRRVGNGLVEVALRGHAAPLPPPAVPDLFAPAGADPAAFDALLERLANRLGAAAVQRPAAGHDPLPEHAGAFVPWASPPLPAVPPPGPRPLGLAAAPKALAVRLGRDGAPAEFHHDGGWRRVVRRHGPERVETGWWRGASARRDYFRAQTADGRWWWLFREAPSGRWRLHGTFD